MRATGSVKSSLRLRTTWTLVPRGVPSAQSGCGLERPVWATSAFDVSALFGGEPVSCYFIYYSIACVDFLQFADFLRPADHEPHFQNELIAGKCLGSYDWGIISCDRRMLLSQMRC